MRYLIFILTVIIFLGCNPNSNTINPNPNPNGTNHDWWFEIKVDGVPHRIGGSFNSCDNNNNWDYKSGSNTSLVSTTSQTQIISILNNKGESDYVSGENFLLSLFDVQNLNLGINDFRLGEGGPESFIGVDCYSYNSSTTNGLRHFSLVPLDTSQYYYDKFPINITQYPTPHSSSNYSNNCYNYTVGDPIIGSGSSTIYVLDTVDNSLPYNKRYRYRRPYNIEIDFKLYMNQ